MIAIYYGLVMRNEHVVNCHFQYPEVILFCHILILKISLQCCPIAHIGVMEKDEFASDKQLKGRTHTHLHIKPYSLFK